MLLKRLEILGFKSFARKTVFEFSPGITAVVGPNGSGKSNVADALRWVLGEQSSKSLRTKKMDEVIFTGSGARGAMGMAEVTIVLDNAHSELPLDAAEVQVTRRLYRSGESEYLLNGRKVRLRDFHDLLARGNVGQNDYTIIGQGLIDVVLSLRPEERRILIEEAADVRRHYEKIEDSRSRLAQTEGNLSRVRDLLTELVPRVGRLKTQAERARSAQATREALNEALASWFGHRVSVERRTLQAARLAVQEASARNTESVTRLHEARAHATTAQARADALAQELSDLQRRRSSLMQQVNDAARERALGEERLRSLQQQAGELQRDIDLLRAELEAARTEVQDLEVQYAPAVAARDRARQLSREAGDALARVERELEHAQRELRATEQARAEREQAAARLRARLDEIDRQIGEQARRAEESVAAREAAKTGVSEAQAAHALTVRDLEACEARLTEYDQFARQSEGQVLTARREVAQAELDLNLHRKEREQVERQLDRMRSAASPKRAVAAFAAAPTLLNLVTIPADLEKPLVAALGAAFDAGVLDGAGIQALSALTSGDGKVVAPVPELAAPGGDGIVGRALDLLPAAPDAVRGLLSRLLVVESSQVALGLLGRYEGDIVTREGVLFRANGLVAFDAVEGEAARKLENQRIQRGLEARIEELTTAVAQAGTRLEQAKSDLAEQLAALDQLNKRRVALLDERRRAQQAVDQSRQRLQQRRQDLEWNERVAAETTRTVASLKDQRDHAVRQLREQEDRQSDIDTVALSERVAALDGERRFLFGAVGRLRGEAADAEAAAAGLEGALQRSRQAAERVERQLTAKIERASEIEAEEQQRQARLMELVGIAERAERALSEAEQPIADLETRLVAIRNQLNGQATELRMLEQASLEAERALLQAENGLSRGQAAWNSLMAELQDDGFEVHTLTTTELPDDLLPETERRVKTLRQQARLAGAVDEDVVNEYESERTRIEHLQQQISDLESARDALDQVMTELQEHSEKQFAIAFDAVAREFQVYFQRFFGGGAARLVLTRPDDLGETGIEIEAQPPGKRFRSLSLLSGGERALTAAALVFAVLQINPTPFCVLDEVDAALDEANVGRFADALRDLADRTQFIVVTHNRNTIDRADGVYGLTMGGDGISKVVSIRLKRNSEEGLALEEQLARTG